ncbi:MAG: hypothetical protein JWO67_4365, partial [Streptosporangiaceae bacterium]|nr:hypothetical protein [Streptosporangiaceae bacterium]
RTGEEPRPLQFQDPAAPAPRLPTIPEEDESGEFGGPPEDMPPDPGPSAPTSTKPPATKPPAAEKHVRWADEHGGKLAQVAGSTSEQTERLLPKGPGTAPAAQVPRERVARAPSLPTIREEPGALAEALEARLAREALPPHDGTSADCVPRLEALWREFYDGPAVVRDDFTVGSARPEDELAAIMGGDWRPFNGSPEAILPQVDRLGPGATAFVLALSPTGPGHAFALRNEGGALFWVETQERPGARVFDVADDPPAPMIDARVIVVDATGRAVPLDDLTQAANTLDGQLLARRDRKQYGAQGRELELVAYVVHGHSDACFVGGSEEYLVQNRTTGVAVKTDSAGLYVAGGRYFGSKRAALASRRGRVTIATVKIIEIVTKPEWVLPGESNRYDPQVVEAGVRDVVRRLKRAVRLRSGAGGPGFRGTTVDELFGDDPAYRMGDNADDLTVFRAPGIPNTTNVQVTDGVPLPAVPSFLLATQRFSTHPDVVRYLRHGLRFGDDATRIYLDERVGRRVGRFAGPAMEYVPGVADIRASMTLLYTHGYAAARVFLLDDGRAKNLLVGALRTSFAGIRESLRADDGAFLERMYDRIREMLEDAIRERLGRHISAYERGRRPLRLLEYPLSNDEMTLGDYVDNMLLPQERVRVRVSQNDAINVRTDYDDTDDNHGAVELELVLVETRDMGAVEESFETAEPKFSRFAGLARSAYDVARRARLNGTTVEGQGYIAALTEAVHAVSAYRPAGRGDIVTDVRDFLDSVARTAPDAVRAPIFRGNVTTNLQADAVTELRDLIRSGDRTAARRVRAAIEAIKHAYRGESSVRSGHGELAHLRRRADRVISTLRRYAYHAREAYPSTEYVNRVASRASGWTRQHAPSEGPQWHEVRSPDGLTVGRVYFPESDWRLRSPFYGELQTAEFRTWSGGPGHRVSAPVQVPLGDRSRMYVLGGHGSELGDMRWIAETVAPEIIRWGFTSLLLVRCAPDTADTADTAGAPPAESRGLRRVAREFGLTIIETTGAVAPTPGVINLLPDAGGRATQVRAYLPDGTVDHPGASQGRAAGSWRASYAWPGRSDDARLYRPLPGLFGRPSRREAERPGWHAGIMLHEIRDANGRFHGLASYAAEELERRRPALPDVPSLTSYSAWHIGTDHKPVPIARPLPSGPGARTFHWFSHGTAGSVAAATHGGGTRSLGADDLVGLIANRLTDFTDIMVWSCQTAPAPERQATLALATRISALTRRRAHVPEWATALDRNPGTGGTAAHTYPAPDGRETGWTSVSPEGDSALVPGSEIPAPVAVAHPGTLVELPVVPEEGESFGSALARGLDRAASILPSLAGARGEPRAESEPSEAADAPYHRLVAGLTEENLPDSAPLIDVGRHVHVADLERAGVVLTSADRTQAVLQKGMLAVAPDLGRVERFRLAMDIAPVTRDTQAKMAEALAAVARGMGVRVVLGETVDGPAGRPAYPEPESRNSPPGHYQRTGAGTAEFEDASFNLYQMHGVGDGFGEALAHTLRDRVPYLDPPATADALYHWVGNQVTPYELPPHVPVEQFRATLTSGARGGWVSEVAALVTARRLGVPIAVASPNGAIRRYGPDGPATVLLVQEPDGRFLAATRPEYSDADYAATDSDPDFDNSEESDSEDETPPDELRAEFEQFYFAHPRDTTYAAQPTVGFGTSLYGPRPERFIAARSGSSQGGRPVYRRDDEPLYRWDSRPPEVIFSEGFRPRSDTLPKSLRLYQKWLDRSGVVSATRSREPDVVSPRLNSDGFTYRYTLTAPGGIDMVATLNVNAYPSMQEVIFWKGIRPKYIERVEVFRCVNDELELVNSCLRDEFFGGRPPQ